MTNTAPTTAMKRPMNPDPTLKTVRFTAHGLLLESNPDAIREPTLETTPGCPYLRHVQADLRDAIRETTPETTPNTASELTPKSKPSTDLEATLEPAPDTTRELTLESTPVTDHALTLEPARVPTREVPLERRRDGSPQRRRGDRGEGVISAAIAVLIIAFLGAAMWVSFNTLWKGAETKINTQVQNIGGSTTSTGN